MLEAHETSKDTLTTRSVTVWDWKDRLKILLFGKTELVTRYETEFFVGRGRHGETECRVVLPERLTRKPKPSNIGGYAVEAEA